MNNTRIEQIMSKYAIEAWHLASDELDYELWVRGVVLPVMRSTKISALELIITDEIMGKSIEPQCIPSECDKKQEIVVVQQKLKCFGILLTHYKSINNKDKARELVSRSLHLKGRLGRLECEDETNRREVGRLMGEVLNFVASCVSFVEGRIAIDCQNPRNFDRRNLPTGIVSQSQGASSSVPYLDILSEESDSESSSEPNFIQVDSEIDVRVNSAIFNDTIMRERFGPSNIDHNPAAKHFLDDFDKDLKIRFLEAEVKALKTKIAGTRRDDTVNFHCTNPFLADVDAERRLSFDQQNFDFVDVPRSTAFVGSNFRTGTFPETRVKNKGFANEKSHSISANIGASGKPIGYPSNWFVDSEIQAPNTQFCNSEVIREQVSLDSNVHRNSCFFPSNWPKELKFSGSNDSISIAQFVREVETFAHVNNISDAQLCACAYYFLSGLAKVWYSNCLTYFDSWVKLKHALWNRFNDPAQEGKSRCEFENRRQKQKETFCDFLDVMVSMMSRLNQGDCTDAYKLRVFRANMDQDLLQSAAPLLIESYDFDKFCQIMISLDRQRRANVFVNVRSDVKVSHNNLSRQFGNANQLGGQATTTNPFANQRTGSNFSYNDFGKARGQFACWNCGGAHPFTTCSQGLRKFCRMCGHQGVETQFCPNCKKN